MYLQCARFKFWVDYFEFLDQCLYISATFLRVAPFFRLEETEGQQVPSLHLLVIFLDHHFKNYACLLVQIKLGQLPGRL